jgi:hypothetical protein
MTREILKMKNAFNRIKKTNDIAPKMTSAKLMASNLQTQITILTIQIPTRTILQRLVVTSSWYRK